MQKVLDYVSDLLPELPAFSLKEPSSVGFKIQPTIGVEAASLLDVLIRSKKPQRLLEIGTSFGFGTCVLGYAAASYGGKVISVEIDEQLATLARMNVESLRLETTVEILTADANEAIQAMNEPFGFILQDGNKDDYLPMLNRLIDMMEPGGLLVTDDVMFPAMQLPENASRLQKSIADYNEELKQCSLLSSTWLPIGDGIAISVKN